MPVIILYCLDSHAGCEFGCVTSSVHVACDVIRDDVVQTFVQNLTCECDVIFKCLDSCKPLQ